MKPIKLWILAALVTVLGTVASCSPPQPISVEDNAVNQQTPSNSSPIPTESVEVESSIIDSETMEVMYQEMLNAISEQDINKVDSLLSQGFDPNYESENSSDWVADFNKPYYVLSHAASFGNDQIVKNY
jgi:hypothetical protein